MERNGKIAGQPRQQEEESVVIGTPSQREPVNLSLLQEVTQRAAASYSCLVFQLCSALQNEIVLLRRKFPVFTGIAIDEVKQHKIKKADEAGGGKTPAPAKIYEQQADQRNSDCGGELRRRVRDRRRQASFFSREPVSQGFSIRGKRGRFAHTQKKACSEEPVDAGGYGGGERGYAPQERADSSHAAHSPLVQQHSTRHLHHGISPTEGAGEISKCNQR